mgnify:CR=1 FL=1
MLEYSFDGRIAAIHTLRVNVKTLQAESRLIRRETERAGPIYRDMLVRHRRDVLRTETRIAHLALAFVRGTPYHAVEARCKTPVDRARLINKIVKHWRRLLESNAVHAWLDAGKVEAAA